MTTTPKVFNWTGSKASNLYWDDPANWAEGEYPNQSEAIVVFSDSLRQNTTVLLRKDIRLAQFWLSEKYDLTFSVDSNTRSNEDDGPGFYFDTGDQFSSIFVDKGNTGSITFARIPMINHSCYWGKSHRSLALGKPLPEGAHVTTISFDGRIRNYKDPERASLQIYGRLIFKLNSANDFKGPVIVKDNGQVQAMVTGAIPCGTPITLEAGGSMYSPVGIESRASKLNIDGKNMAPGIYISDELDANALEEITRAYSGLSEHLPIAQVCNLKGGGVLIVDY